MGKKWKNAPVMYTVAQVRFNQILAMETYVPAIQEELRNIGFPDFRKEVINALSITIGQANSAPPIMQPVNRFIFSNVDDTSGFTLETNALSFQLTDYDVFETFLETFIKVLSIIHKHVSLSFIERIGVRYLDAVQPKAGEDLSQYLVSEVLGMTFKLSSYKVPGKLLHSYTETLSENVETGSKLVARTIIQDGKLTLPPEIAQIAYSINKKFDSYQGCHAIIDNDGYLDQMRTPFDLDLVRLKLDQLHEEIAESFKNSATDFAIKTWKSGE
jgi:uncharacterized protein (TIGR04255 family)